MIRQVSALLAGVLLAACSSEPGEAQTATAIATAEETPLERALLEDLVLANRILTREEGILDIQAHVSVRSRTNPERWYMARYVAPGGASVSDMSEYDLDGFPIVPRGGDARETFLHGNVYKARPDVQAVVHAHTPEFVSFAMSTVPLYWGPGDPVPVWDIRPLNDERNGIVSDNRLGASMAETMEEEEAVLLSGHGFVMTGDKLYNAVRRAYYLRQNAISLQQAMALGGTVAYLNERRMPTQPQPAAEVATGTPVQGGGGQRLGPVEGREWVYLAQTTPLD